MDAPKAPPLYTPVSRKGQEFIRAASLTCWAELRDLICSIVNIKEDLEGLKEAVEKFSENIPQPWSFYVDLLPKIKSWALEEHNVELPIMRPYVPETATLTLTPRIARHILANVFFLNIVLLSPDDRMKHRLGELSYYGLYIRDQISEAVERIICQIAYFYKSTNDAELDERPAIRFERSWSQEAVEIRQEYWQKSQQQLPPADRLNVHSLAMEDTPGKAFVDFANKFIHIGCLIPSLTQEEVLFSCCPEAFLCLLFISELREREVVVIRNVRRCSTYTGYLSSFCYTGMWPGLRLHDILVIDACIGGQFSAENVLRDVEKAYLSFVACPGDRISTGHWGCGAFGGDKTLKFLQQLCAAAAANAHLDYSTFRDEPLANKFRELHRALLEKNITVGRIFRTLPRFRQRRVADFAAWIEDQLLNQQEVVSEEGAEPPGSP